MNTAPSTPTEARAILRARAEALAREPEQAAPGQTALDILEFRLAAGTYAVELPFVREVHSLREYTPVPGTPPFVLGIANVRGEIISIIDLTRLLGLPDKGLGQLNKVVVLSGGGMEFGILADDILGTRTLAADTIQTAPLTGYEIGTKYLLGVTSKRVIVLDAAGILADEKMVVSQGPDQVGLRYEERGP
jgi:purine-binding chemotaxis protein CheW